MVFGIKKGAKKLRERNRMIRNIFISTDLVQYGFGCMNDFQWINRYCLLIVFPFHRKIGIYLCIIFRWFRKRFTIDITEKKTIFFIWHNRIDNKGKTDCNKTIEYFWECQFFSLCVLFCHWLFPSSIELSIRSCRENIWKKGIASKSQQTVCQRTSSTGALNITNVISICGALRCCRCRRLHLLNNLFANVFF